MDAIGAAEVLLPALQPVELWQRSGRDVAYGDNLFKFKDRHGRTSVLGPTHEEVVTELVSAYVSSYKQLPLSLYQIQTKFRDEFRPRFGLLRVREFLMKDAYSFHADLPSLDRGVRRSFTGRTSGSFTRCGRTVRGGRGRERPDRRQRQPRVHGRLLGRRGHDPHQRQGQLRRQRLRRPQTGDRRPTRFGGDPKGALEKVHTPGLSAASRTWASSLKVKPKNILKTLVFQTEREQGDAGERDQRALGGGRRPRRPRGERPAKLAKAAAQGTRSTSGPSAGGPTPATVRAEWPRSGSSAPTRRRGTSRPC